MATTVTPYTSYTPGPAHLNIFKTYKQYIRDYMQAHYTDQRLAWLLAHARDGKLSFHSCCCFVGIPTADHALQGETSMASSVGLHYFKAKAAGGMQAGMAESGFAMIGRRTLLTHEYYQVEDARRRRVIIPMVRAEMRRRALASAKAITEARELLDKFHTAYPAVADIHALSPL